MSHYFYITPEEYAEAAHNGIAAAVLEYRVRTAAWDKDKAINTPVRKLTDRSQWWTVAQQNGIKYDAFMSRINMGWTEERAATKPLQTPEEIKASALRATEHIRKIPREIIELAAKNGIQHATLHRRITREKLSFEEAATRPLMTRQEIGRRGAKALRAREGDWAAPIFSKSR